MTRCWVEFCEQQVPNTWQPALVGEPFTPKRRPHCFGSVPIIRCVNRKSKLKCFRQDACTRRWSSLSPVRPGVHLAGGSSSSNKRLGPTPGSRHSWPWFASSQTCKDECMGDVPYRMRVPSGCDKHILEHMRCNCAACMNFACHWRRALKDQLKFSSTDLLTNPRKARRCAPILNRPSPRQQLDKAGRTSSPERRFASSGKKPSPKVSWWFGKYVPSTDSEADLSAGEKSTVEKELSEDTLKPSFYLEQTVPKTYDTDGFESVAMDGTMRPSRLQETDQLLPRVDEVYRSTRRGSRMAPKTQDSSAHYIPIERNHLVQGIEGEAHDFGNVHVDDLRDVTYHRTPYASDDGPETLLQRKHGPYPEIRPSSNSKCQRSPGRNSHLPSSSMVSDFTDKYSSNRDNGHCHTRLSYHDHQNTGDSNRDDSENCYHRKFSRKECHRGRNGSPVETFELPNYPKESSKRMLFSDSPRHSCHINTNPYSHPKEEENCCRMMDTGDVSPRSGRIDRNRIGHRQLYRVWDFPAHEKTGNNCCQSQGHDLISRSPPRLRDLDQERISMDSEVLQSHHGRHYAQSPLQEHALRSGQRFEPLPLSSHMRKRGNKTGNFGKSHMCPPKPEAINTTCIPSVKLKNQKHPKLNTRRAHADKILTNNSRLDSSPPAQHFSRWVTVDPDSVDQLTNNSRPDHELRGGRTLTRASSDNKLNNSDDSNNKTNPASVGGRKDLTHISDTCRVRHGHDRPSCTAAVWSSHGKYQDVCSNRRNDKQTTSMHPEDISTCGQEALISATRQKVPTSRRQVLKSSLQAPVDRQDHHRRQTIFLQSPTHENRQTAAPTSPTHEYRQTAAPTSATHEYRQTLAPTSPTHEYRQTAALTSRTHEYKQTAAPTSRTHEYRETAAPTSRTHEYRMTAAPTYPTHEYRQTAASTSPADHRGHQPHSPGREMVRGSHQQTFNSSQNSTHFKPARHDRQCRHRPSRKDEFKDENTSNSSKSATANDVLMATDTSSFGPSLRVLREARSDSQPEWAAKHVSLMTECSQQQQKVAKSRMVRIVNKTQALSRTSRQMRLNFGDLDQRLDKVYELQQTYFGRVDEAIRRLQQRDPSLDQCRPTLQRCQDALGQSLNASP